MLILLLAAWAAFRLRLASHPPLLFRPETNIQSLLNLQDNLSSPAIACHTCSGLFLENPRPLHFPPAPWPPPEVPDPPDLRIPGLLRNVYISQFLGENFDEPVYRFSLDPMVPSPWQQLPPGRGNVPYFKAFARPWGNFSQRLTVCASRLGLPTGGCPAKFLLTDFSCDGRRGWSFNFSFFVALKPQLSSRRLFFAQARRFPFNSRVCLGPQGCMVAPTAKGPNRQAFYVPYAAGAVPRPPLSLRGYNPCSDGPGCGPPASRPLVDSGAIVFLVFGILGLNQSSTHENHVIGNNGRVVYDPSFDLHRELPHLCLLCKAFAANDRLVVDGGAQCLPQGLSLSALPVLPSECHALPQPHLLPGQLSHAALGFQAGRVAWIAMAFKSVCKSLPDKVFFLCVQLLATNNFQDVPCSSLSTRPILCFQTTPHGRPAFQALTDYLQWENFLKEQLTNLPPDSALRHGFHTCQHWKQVFIEVLGIQGSLQSLGLSMGTCFLAIMIFTSHPVLLLTVMSTILGVLAVMVLFLWLVGGEFGAVEAISLSIVIGSSVDYSLHLVECYIHSPVEVHMTPRATRAQCAANQICLPIFSSGLTTVASALPLLFCTIAPFACFGRALSIAAVASLAGALILGPAILAFIGPSNFKRDGWAVSKALTIGLVTVMIGFGIKAALGWSSDDEPVAERTLGVLT
uniref:DUF7023 domain-containing protein n=1 Tax=Eptatretus burgeri TaxID=7764 RepID=A0A8C4NGJ2_EPTBU